MESRMDFQVRIDPAEEGGFVAQCVEIPGAISQGETPEEALENVRDALRMILEQRRLEARKAPMGDRARFATVAVND